MKPLVSMRQALSSPKLFGHVLQGQSWSGWRILLIAAAGEKLTETERVEFKRLTGRDKEPGRMCRELIVVAGRRAGKSMAMATLNVWLAALCDYKGVLAPGEVGVALIISRDQRVAKIILNYIDGILRSSDVLSSMIANRTADTVELTNGIQCEVRPASHKNLRGPTYVSVIADEIAHWDTAVDYTNPDVEILAAVRPGLLTTSGPLCLVSSAYAKHGELYEAYTKYFGPDGPPDVLVAYASSRDLNPSLPQEEIDRALEKDPVRNRAEYLSQWRDDTAGFVPREAVEACVRGYLELPPQPGISYKCAFDPASGVPDGDSLAIVISHKSGDRVVIDAIREIKPPFDFFVVIETILKPLCKAYRIHRIVGDAYAGELARVPVRKVGVGYDLSEKSASELYIDPFLPMLNAGKIDLPKHDRAVTQICQLERSPQRSGREQITHPTRGHDDIANCIALAVDLAINTSGYRLDVFDPDFIDEDRRQPPAKQQPAPTGQYFGTNQWWREMPRQEPTYSANERLLQGYKMLAGPPFSKK
jgi:hypothetical protein